MICIKDKSKCCGCEACVQICPKHCIRFVQDGEGFFYPSSDSTQCIECGLCEKVCPNIHPYDEHIPNEVLSVVNVDEEIRRTSSSGGVFSLLANCVIDKGGVVFGVRFNEQWQAVFDSAETKEKILAFRGSKYIQARVGNSYRYCKEMLIRGRKVLFVGTPCQISALNHYLMRPYPNLLTVDIICHGVPSPLVWDTYLDKMVPQGRTAISKIVFRDKRTGWKNFSFTLKYIKDDKIRSFSSLFNDNAYCEAFDKNLILRPSCFLCPAKGGRSHSDLTIADFWGIDKVNPSMDDDMGTSVVLIHTEKGNEAINRDLINYSVASYEDVLLYNPSVMRSAIKHPKRDIFFEEFGVNDNILKLLSRYTESKIKRRVKRMLKYPFNVLFKKIRH